MHEHTILPLAVGINLIDSYDTIQRIRAMADILIPIHDVGVGRKPRIPE